MRDIKFRAWDGAEEEWLSYEEAEQIKFQVSPNGLITIFGDEWATQDYELMQYTGLKDKNGKEIYEGDILKPYENNFAPQKVFFHDGQWVMGGNVMCLKLGESNSGQFEIIGNVYENGDLL